MRPASSANTRQGFFARGKVLGLALMRDKEQTAALIELLAWYREMGVTEAVAERPTPR